MLIRDAVPEDVATLMQLSDSSSTAAHWSREVWQSLFSPNAPPRIVQIAEQDGVAVGFVLAGLAIPDCEIENIVVRPEFRRLGTGAELLRGTIERARHGGCDRVLLEVRQSNHTAIGFYQSLGFAELGRRKNYYGNPPEDALILGLRI